MKSAYIIAGILLASLTAPVIADEIDDLNKIGPAGDGWKSHAQDSLLQRQRHKEPRNAVPASQKVRKP